MPGVGHIGYLTDIEALQDPENILGPGLGIFGRRIGAGVHFHFQSGERGCIPERDCSRHSDLRNSENGITV
jgi:hypothetical protein